MGEIPAAEVAKVLERALHPVLGVLVCEACGERIGGLRYALHHRHPKGRGGTKLPWIHTAVNLMLVHGDFSLNCHNLTEYSIHQNPTRSYRLGHMVRRGTHPAMVPVIVEPRLRELRA